MRIAEIFGPTIQGEGPLAGRVTNFVRVGGCDYRCKWCDSLHAVDSDNRFGWFEMMPDEVMSHIQALGPRVNLITLSGGNPAIPEDMPELVDLLHSYGHRVALETQASIYRNWFEWVDYLILSPKPPSSGHVLDDAVLAQCLEHDTAHVKIVMLDKADFEFAYDVAQRHKIEVLWVQPCNPFPGLAKPMWSFDDEGVCDDSDPADLCYRYRQLCDMVLADERCRNWRVLPQLHTLAWGNERGK